MLNDRLANDVRRNGTHSGGTELYIHACIQTQLKVIKVLISW